MIKINNNYIKACKENIVIKCILNALFICFLVVGILCLLSSCVDKEEKEPINTVKLTHGTLSVDIPKDRVGIKDGMLHMGIDGNANYAVLSQPISKYAIWQVSTIMLNGENLYEKLQNMIIALNPSYTNYEIRTENEYKFLTGTAGSLSTSSHFAYTLFNDSVTIYYIRISIVANYSFDFNEITSILDTATLTAVF